MNEQKGTTNRYLSAKDIQKRLPLSRAGIYCLLHHAQCPTIHIGKRLVVREDEFEIFITTLKENGGTI